MQKKLEAPMVISLGGSIMVPPSGIDIKFLKKFRQVILTEIKKGRRFILIAGGGATARAYMRAADTIISLKCDDQDWLGIHSCRLNGHLLRTIFRLHAHPFMMKDPRYYRKWTESILIATGWKPGWSSDYVAVRFAKLYGASAIVNLTNLAQVYDRDPKKFKSAKPISAMSWSAFQKMVGTKWTPGMHVPFDPIATRLAARLHKKVIVASGHDMKNLQKILDGQPFVGTVIE